MIETLLQTKLFKPPLRPNLVPRQHLIERLNQGLQHGHRLTLISAPAGFGKTTLASEWAAGCGRATAWLSLDEGDNDPVRFLTYLTAALQVTSPGIGEGVPADLQSSQQPTAESILITLLNDVAAIPDNFVLILDDYHLIDSQPVDATTSVETSTSVDEILTTLLERMPPQMHLVLATREDPQLPLSRLRAKGWLSELRAVDLRFKSTEAAEFLNRVMGLDLPPQDIAALESRTEGWIAGLQLAALSMQGRDDTAELIQSFTGSHRYVLDYLIEEVLELQPRPVQEFLLRTAVLKRLTGSLCNALTGRDDGRETLAMLDRANLFIVPLDEERRWYRYHHLFADLLKQRLRHTFPGEDANLHKRASAWYELNGFTETAIEHALLARDYERAALLIGRTADSLWEQGDDKKLRRWLDRLPAEMVFEDPQFCVVLAWNYLANGEQDQAEKTLQAGEQALDLRPNIVTLQVEDPVVGQNEAALRGRIATTRAFAAFYRGAIPEILQHASEALDTLPEQELSWRSTAIHLLGDAHDLQGEMVDTHRARLEGVEASRATGNSYVSMIANLKLAIALRHQGVLQQTVEICEQQMQLATGSGMAQTAVTGWLLAIWGEALSELNDLDGAVQKGKKGIELLERGGDLAMLGSSYLGLIRILFSSGDLAAAGEIAHKAAHPGGESTQPPWIISQQAAWQARLWLAQGKRTAVSRWVIERGLDSSSDLSYLRELEYIVFARFLIADQKLDEAKALLTRLLGAAEAAGRTSRAIEILNLQALAHQTAGDTDQATAALERSLSLAEPGGFIRTFVDEGPLMAGLLHEAVARGISPDYARQLLAAFSTAAAKQSASSETFSESRIPQTATFEPLSARELEVLQLIGEGLTNRDIADKLYLSLNTVKAHTRNIYGKLDVHNRTQAVARARATGILSSS